MSFRLESIFTHVDDLEEETDPKALKPLCVKVDAFPSSTTKSTPKCPDMSKPVQATSLAGLLEGASKKVYGTPPTYTEHHVSGGLNGLFRTECVLGQWNGEGLSRNKKYSKHLAAKDVLLQIVDSGNYLKFGIPGENKESAKEYINGLMPDLEKENAKSEPTDTAALENQDWISQCIHLCINRNVGSQPQYDYPKQENDKSTNAWTFHCTATLHSQKLKQPLSVTATGASKKKAQHQAAKELYPLIQQDFPAPESDKKNMISGSSKTPQGSPRKSAAPTPDDKSTECQSTSSEEESLQDKKGSNVELDLSDLKLVLHQIASNEVKWHQKSESILRMLVESENPQVQKVFDTKELKFEVADANDPENIQVYLEITSPSKKAPKNVFFGEGQTVEFARGRAAWQALEFLYIFGGFANEMKEELAAYAKEAKEADA